MDDPVAAYLPDWPEPWAGVTLRHLLSHTSGLPRLVIAWPHPDVGGLGRSGAPERPRSVLDLVAPSERLLPLDFRPGEGFAWSDLGYVLLGDVVEKVSGKPYVTFLQDEILRSLGMRNSGSEDPGEIVPRLATGYAGRDDQVAPAEYVDLRLAAAAAGIYSTVDDLLLWDRALASGRILPASLQERMLTPGRAGYALGWWVQQRFGRRVEWHPGEVQGFTSIIVRYPDDDLFLAVLSNLEGTQVQAIANALAAMAFRLPCELPRERTPAVLDPGVFDAYVGTYTNRESRDDSFTFRREGKRLMVEDPGVGSFDVLAESRTRLFANAVEWDAEFVVDDRGKVMEVRSRHDGVESRWRPSGKK